MHFPAVKSFYGCNRECRRLHIHWSAPQMPHAFSTAHDGYEEIPTASYRILLMTWSVCCFVVANSFSGGILAFMNVRLFDAGVDSVAALEVALQRRTLTGGTMRDSLMSAMIDVCEFFNPICINCPIYLNELETNTSVHPDPSEMATMQFIWSISHFRNRWEAKLSPCSRIKLRGSRS